MMMMIGFLIKLGVGDGIDGIDLHNIFTCVTQKVRV